MAKTRVHELAKEFGVESKFILAFAKSRGEFIKSASSVVEPPLELRIKRELRAEMAAESATFEQPDISVKDLESGLAGSPYSLPSEQREYIDTTLLPLVATLTTRVAHSTQRITASGRRQLARVNRTLEVYESNQIEGLGPDLATTDRVLRGHSLDREVGYTVAEAAIRQCIDAEPKVRDVVGLGAAKVLAEQFCRDVDRPLVESDIRQLHSLVMVGDSRGGQYKRYANEIEGSAHKPPTPLDTPHHMGELIRWVHSNSLPPLWEAAVVHAWLAHVHPFHDGNGRIARLLANLLLIRGGMPPLIVRASSDRGRYLDALGASDEGGNILPLVRVFRRVVARAAADMESPDFAARLFEAEVARRYGSYYTRWDAAYRDFMNELASRLLLNRLSLEHVGAVGSSDFERTLSRGTGTWRGAGNYWVAKVRRTGYRQDLLLHVAWPSNSNLRLLERDEQAPSIFVSVRNQRPLDARQYLPVGGEGFAYEFTPIVDTGTVLVRMRTDARRLRTRDAAQVAATALERVARQLIVA